MREIDEAGGPERWTDHRVNKQHSPSRPVNAAGGPFKAAAVYEAAIILADRSIDDADDFLERRVEAQRLIERVRGIGPATSGYVVMLLGIPGVKPDRMIRRFGSDALAGVAADFSCTNSAIREAITMAAEHYPGENETNLEHAIWAWQREQLSRWPAVAVPYKG